MGMTGLFGFFGFLVFNAFGFTQPLDVVLTFASLISFRSSDILRRNCKYLGLSNNVLS